MGIKKIIAVAAGKGGVGKSTVTAALALASAMRGLKVGVLDADVYGPSIPLLLPDTAQVTVEGERIVPAKSGAIQTLSITHFGITDTSTAFRAPVVNMFIQQCVHQVEWGDLDVLYVDFPPGVGDVHLCLLQEWAFSGVVLVTMPNRVSQSDVEKAGDSFVEMGVPVAMVIENFSGVAIEGMAVDAPLFGTGAGALLQQRYEAPSLEKIPLDPKFAALLNAGENPFMQSRLSAAAKRFLEIEEALDANAIGSSVEAVADGPFLELRYADGLMKKLRLSAVQKACPCKRCAEQPRSPMEDLMASKVTPVGRYGLKFAFISGCSQGLYSHRLLKGLPCAD